MAAPLGPQPPDAPGHSTPPALEAQGPPEAQAVAAGRGAAAAAAAAAAKPSRAAATPAPTSPSPGAPAFPLFGQLPAEIRLQVWRAALPPRTVELHSGRYSSHYARSTPGPWHSSSGNPAPLAACAEARLEGLRRYYTVALPVVAPAADPGNGSSHHNHGRPGPPANPERRLYLDPRRDTLVVLGALEYRRLEALGAAVARQDARGLRRLALTTGGFTRGSAGPELRVWARVGLLAGLDQFTLLLDDARWPPAEAAGGAVAVVPCAPGDRRYAAFATGHRHHLGAGSGWIVVGARGRRMDVARLAFVRADGVPVDGPGRR